VGNYTNGSTQNIGQIALASFVNPQGLNKVESGLYVESANSGIPNVGAPNTSARGSITASALEQSNVDLGGEFTKMIVAQRAFQANSRIVTTYDEILNEVANMKR
jgi:flagellar hook protein FlgE